MYFEYCFYVCPESFILPPISDSKFQECCESWTIVRTYSKMEMLVTGKFMELSILMICM